MLPVDFINEFISPALIEQIRLLHEGEVKQFSQAPLRTCLGEKRLVRLCRHPAIRVKPENEFLNQKEFQALLAGVGLVFADDVRELWEECRDESRQTVRHLTVQQTIELRACMHHVDADRNPLVIGQLMKVLIPVANIESLLPNDLAYQNKKLTSTTCGKGHLGLQAIVWTLHKCRLLSCSVEDPDLVLEYCYQLYGKRLADLEPPAGLMIAHPDGWYTNLEPIHGTFPDNRGVNIFKGGHYIIPLKAMTVGLMNSLLCRGTRVKRKATDPLATCAENLRTCQGAQIKQALEPVHELLREPARGFVTEELQPVRIIGMSLGGAHAARLAIAFYQYVRECVLLSPVGLDHPSLEYYAHLINTKHLDFKPAIKIITNPLDNVAFFGHGHLGWSINPDKIRVDITWLSLEKVEVNWPEEFIQLTLPPSRKFLQNTKVAKIHSFIEFEDPNHSRLTVDNQTNRELVNRMLDNRCDRRATFEESRRKITRKLPLGQELDFKNKVSDYHLHQHSRFHRALSVHQGQFKSLAEFDLAEGHYTEYLQKAALHRWQPTKDCILPRRFGKLVRRFAALQTHATLNAWLSHYVALLNSRPKTSSAKNKARQIAEHPKFVVQDEDSSSKSLFQRLVEIDDESCLIELIATPRIGPWNEKRFARGFDTLIKDFPVLKSYENLLREAVIQAKMIEEHQETSLQSISI